VSTRDFDFLAYSSHFLDIARNTAITLFAFLKYMKDLCIKTVDNSTYLGDIIDCIRNP
jgi:hypothetical protein